MQRLLLGLPEPQARARPVLRAGPEEAPRQQEMQAERKVEQPPLPQVAAVVEGLRQGAPPLDSSEELRQWLGAELRAWPEQHRPEDARRLGRQAALQRSREPAVEARSQSEAPDAAEASRCGAEPELRP